MSFLLERLPSLSTVSSLFQSATDFVARVVFGKKSQADIDKVREAIKKQIEEDAKKESARLNKRDFKAKVYKVSVEFGVFYDGEFSLREAHVVNLADVIPGDANYSNFEDDEILALVLNNDKYLQQEWVDFQLKYRQTVDDGNVIIKAILNEAEEIKVKYQKGTKKELNNKFGAIKIFSKQLDVEYLNCLNAVTPSDKNCGLYILRNDYHLNIDDSYLKNGITVEELKDILEENKITYKLIDCLGGIRYANKFTNHNKTFYCMINSKHPYVLSSEGVNRMRRRKLAAENKEKSNERKIRGIIHPKNSGFPGLKKTAERGRRLIRGDG